MTEKNKSWEFTNTEKYDLELFYFRHSKLIRFYLRLCIGICLFTSIEVLLLLWDIDYLYFIWENLYRWINPRIRDLITTISFILFQLLTIYVFGLYIWENYRMTERKLIYEKSWKKFWKKFSSKNKK